MNQQCEEHDTTQTIDALVLAFLHDISIFLCSVYTQNFDCNLYKSSRYWSPGKAYMLRLYPTCLLVSSDKIVGETLEETKMPL